MKPLILLVDDEPASLKLLSQILLWEGFRTLAVATPEKAFGFLEETRPDLILLDMEFSRTATLRLIRRIRKTRETRHLPVIVLSAHAMKEEMDRAAAAGCDAYITKPIDTRKFCQQISQHLRAPFHS